VNVGMLDGQLAWRQHDGGHTDGPNWKYFLPWADKFLKHAPAAGGSAVPPSPAGPADRATPRTDQNSMIAHAQLLEKARAGRIDVYFVGDSITRRWGATDYPELLAHWRQNFFGWNAGNFGWGADRTENILWRLEHGELEGVHPKVIVIQAGTNNIGAQPGGAAKVAEITRGLTAIVDLCLQQAPRATVILTAIFPRNDNMAVMPEIDQVNANLARLANGRNVRYLNINDKLADKDGRLLPGMMNERDKLHPTMQGYQVWAEGLKPILTELLGPPGSTDHAPPPTGDPSARR
jgi:lysophospholipase L1-like esterase